MHFHRSNIPVIPFLASDGGVIPGPGQFPLDDGGDVRGALGSSSILMFFQDAAPGFKSGKGEAGPFKHVSPIIPLGLTNLRKHGMYHKGHLRAQAQRSLDGRGSNENAPPVHQKFAALIGLYSLFSRLGPCYLDKRFAIFHKKRQALLKKDGTMDILVILGASPPHNLRRA